MKFHFKKKNVYIIAVLTIIVLYFSLRKDATTIITYITKASPGWLLISISCLIIYWLVEARTLHIMIKVYEPKFSFLQMVKLNLSTQFFNAITPFSTGGQPFQIYILNKRSNLSLSSISSASLQNFIVYQSVLVAFGTLAIITKNLFNLFPNNINNYRTFAFIGFGLNAAIILFLIGLSYSSTFTHFITHTVLSLISKTPLIKDIDESRLKLNNIISRFHSDIQLIWRDKILFVHAIILNSLKLLSFYSISYFIARAVGLESITILQAIIASAYVMLLTSIVPIPGASVGAEFGFLLFFGSFITIPKATAIMLLWRFITYYIGLFTGFFVFTLGYCSTSNS